MQERPAGPAGGGFRLPAALRGAAPGLLAVILLFLIWEAVCRLFGIREFLLPTPSAIFSASIAAWPLLLWHAWATFLTVLWGFFASVAISLPLAMLIASSPAVSAAIYPLLVITQSIPKVALAPILIIALGANELPRIIVTFLVAFFPLVVGTVAGLLATPPELIELGRACRAGRMQELLRIRLPFAIPFVFGGLKVAAALAVVGAVVAEFVGADAGLGYLIQTSMAFFRTPLAFAAVVALAIMGILMFQAVSLTERLLFPWSSGAEPPAPGI
ncbi:ABC transporter permease [Siccirubricoccus sp. G192]|uniref:ABC transporter permease n=1 Tax=Siccirubricoccus sp. G192 TaxID=2849651 RepID=UPI001C2C4CF9|nr:ABC transporter permease [Siccirubricoccus sp. G192]MBV1796503.1 ABC transporter permease [Siccirubricoccus sp. G192]